MLQEVLFWRIETLPRRFAFSCVIVKELRQVTDNIGGLNEHRLLGELFDVLQGFLLAFCPREILPLLRYALNQVSD